MKKVIVLMLLLSLAAFPCLTAGEEAQETAAADQPAAETEVTELPADETETEEQPEAEAGMTDAFDIRYRFEHRMLREKFYSAPVSTMKALRENGLYRIWSDFIAEEHAESSYSEADFGMREVMQESGIQILLLTMPEPEDTLLCYRIYLCFDPGTATAAYYTAEYDKYAGYFDEGCLICGWNRDGEHQFYAEGRILPESGDPEYEKELAEETVTVLELMRARIRPEEEPSGGIE